MNPFILQPRQVVLRLKGNHTFALQSKLVIFSYELFAQGRSQTRNLGWAREEYFLIIPHFSIICFHFSSIFPHFLPQFDAPGGRFALPGMPWLRYCLCPSEIGPNLHAPRNTRSMPS